MSGGVMTSPSATLPDFLYIGVARAGSTWLFEVLRAHPEIFIPPAKDLYFFDRYYDKGLDWYRHFFRDRGGARVAGELSHDYYVSREAAERIRRDLPEVKLVCCLREPVACLLSGYRYNRTMNVGANVSLAEYAARDHVRHQFDYYGNLKVYYDRFDRHQIHVVFYDELQRDPVSFARSIYEFLGVDPEFVAPTVGERINPARAARNEALAQFTYRVSLGLRRAGMANLVGTLKRSPLVNRLLYTQEKRAVDDSQIPREVVEEFRKDFARLEELIGRPLPGAWYG